MRLMQLRLLIGEETIGIRRIKWIYVLRLICCAKVNDSPFYAKDMIATRT